MRLNERQQRIIEENMGLVGKVIKDKVHGLGQAGMLSCDDLSQITFLHQLRKKWG